MQPSAKRTKLDTLDVSLYLAVQPPGDAPCLYISVKPSMLVSKLKQRLEQYVSGASSCHFVHYGRKLMDYQQLGDCYLDENSPIIMVRRNQAPSQPLSTGGIRHFAARYAAPETGGLKRSEGCECYDPNYCTCDGPLSDAVSSPDDESPSDDGDDVTQDCNDECVSSR